MWQRIYPAKFQNCYFQFSISRWARETGMAMASSGWGEEDDWELINDDGFVYKCKKRPRLDPISSTSAPPPDPVVEEKNRRERKRKALIKLKERYQNEIQQWELLSNTLKELNIKFENQRQPHQLEINQLPVESPVQSSDSTCCRLLDDLLAQAEAQEAMISNVSYLCHAAEALCNAQEEQSKKSLIDLPIWTSSPRELMNSLCNK